MKRKLILLIILCLFALPLHAGVTGSVSLANIRLSLVDGTAFVDFSAAATLTPYLNGKLTLTDSAGKKAIGYIKAAGTGETLGDELIANTGFESDVSGWTPARGTFAQDNTIKQAGTYSGVLTVSAGQTSAYVASQASSYVAGGLYKMTAYVHKNTGSDLSLRLLNQADSGFAYTVAVNPLSFTLYALYGVLPLNETAIKAAVRMTGTEGNKSNIDETSLRLVLTPSATGVTITSTPGGTTYNWASIEAGFNYNDASGYTYTIEFPGGLLLMGVGR